MVNLIIYICITCLFGLVVFSLTRSYYEKEYVDGYRILKTINKDLEIRIDVINRVLSKERNKLSVYEEENNRLNKEVTRLRHSFLFSTTNGVLNYDVKTKKQPIVKSYEKRKDNVKAFKLYVESMEEGFKELDCKINSVDFVEGFVNFKYMYEKEPTIFNAKVGDYIVSINGNISVMSSNEFRSLYQEVK